MFWFGAIVSLCYVPGITGAYIATQWPVLAIVLPFGLLRSGPFTWLHGAGLAFIAYATVHMFWTPAPYSSVFGLWLIWLMGLAVWFGTTMKDSAALYRGLAIGGIVSSAIAVLQQFGLDLLPQTSGDAAGLYVNRVQQGTILALLTVALVSERLWFWALPLLPGIYLSGSRGALLILAVGLLGCYVRRVWVFGLIGVAGAFYLAQPLTSSDQERMLIWATAWQNLTFWGWGPGIFFTILIPKNGTFFFPEHAHNDALQLFFEYGVGALLPLVLFGFVLLRTSEKEWPVILAFLTAGCFCMPLWMPVTSFLALVAVGRVLRLYAFNGVDSDFRRQYGLSWQRSNEGGSREAVSLASRHHAKG